MTKSPTTALAAPLGAGAFVAVGLGIYGAVHEPTGRDFVLAGFESSGTWKSSLASLAVVLFVVQVTIGLRMTGRYGPDRPAPPWMPDLHRIVGSLAFGTSLPVAFHCLWVLGYRGDDPTVVAHSVLGFTAYGLYTAKVLVVRRDLHDVPTTDGGRPEWAVPLLGVALGTTMIALWWSSALVFWVS